MLLLAAALAIAAPSALADRAVVVGVQFYAHLPRANTLQGCVNDANSLAKRLRETFGFEVTLLTNEKGTKSGILKAIEETAAKTQPHERFVFYFAGHGRTTPNTGLMPHDAKDADDPKTPELECNTVTADELNAAVRKVPARSHTVILDSCYSGAMSRNRTSGKLRSRFYFPQTMSRSFGPPEPANDLDFSQKMDKGGGVAYMTAAKDNEKAFEGVFGDEAHGLFTHTLLENLSRQDEPWHQVYDRVRIEMAKTTSEEGVQQNPTLSPAFNEVPVFESPKATKTPRPPSKTMLDVFNRENPDRSQFALRVFPNKTDFTVGEKLKLGVQAGAEGWLVVLGQIGGKYELYYPKSDNPDRAKILPGPERYVTVSSRGDRLTLDNIGSDLIFNEAGSNQVKAFFFTDRAKAEAVLQAFRGLDPKLSWGQMNAQTDAAAQLDGGFFTAGFTFDVDEALIGGYEIKKPLALLKRLIGAGDPMSKHLWNLLGPDQKVLKEIPPGEPLSKKAVTTLSMILNFLVQEEEVFDAGAFEDVALSPDTKALLNAKPAKGSPKGIELNMRLLADALRDEIGLAEAANGGNRDVSK